MTTVLTSAITCYKFTTYNSQHNAQSKKYIKKKLWQSNCSSKACNPNCFVYKIKLVADLLLYFVWSVWEELFTERKLVRIKHQQNIKFDAIMSHKVFFGGLSFICSLFWLLIMGLLYSLGYWQIAPEMKDSRKCITKAYKHHKIIQAIFCDFRKAD